MSNWNQPNFNRPDQVKAVPISKLPKRWRIHLEGLVEDPKTTKVNVVLASNGKAYVGYPELYEYKEDFQANPTNVYNATKIVSPEDVARVGNLLDAKETEAVFGKVKHG